MDKGSPRILSTSPSDIPVRSGDGAIQCHARKATPSANTTNANTMAIFFRMVRLCDDRAFPCSVPRRWVVVYWNEACARANWKSGANERTGRQPAGVGKMTPIIPARIGERDGRTDLG